MYTTNVHYYSAVRAAVEEDWRTDRHGEENLDYTRVSLCIFTLLTYLPYLTYLTLLTLRCLPYLTCLTEESSLHSGNSIHLYFT